MPEISRFFGIRITMYADDHAPPHFHARYQDDEAMISIRDGSVLEGSLSGRMLKAVQEWCEMHRAELMSNWNILATGAGEAERIAPLE